MTQGMSLTAQTGERYRREALLGRGGTSDVYLAHDVALDRRVALKVLHTADAGPRLEAEARVLARLDHPGLVRVLDAGERDGRPFLVLELVEGATLAQRIADGPLPAAEVARLGAALASALDHVHRNGVIHRDVKPGNVLLARDGRVLLADFGVARLVEGSGLTATGVTMGTAAYLAPEQVRGEQLTPALDLYSLGLVLLEALTGERAYPGPAVEAAVARLERGPDIPDRLPEAWRALLGALTRPVAADRPSAAEAAARLESLTSTAVGPPTRALTQPFLPSRTQALPRVPAEAPGRRSGGRRAPAVALPLAAALLGFLLVRGLLGGDADPTPQPRPLPGGLPSGVSSDLRDLHDAVEAAR